MARNQTVTSRPRSAHRSMRDARVLAARRAFGSWKKRSLKKDLQILSKIRRGWERPLA